MRQLAFYTAVMVASILMAFADGYAQDSLMGQTFSNANISFVNDGLGNVNTLLASKRDSLLNAKEKEKGRKLTPKEVAKFDQDMEEGQKMLSALQKAIKMGITVNFKSTNEVEMKIDTKVDDKLMKDAGVGWLQRSAIKTSLKMMPKSMKEKYIRKGNMIIVSPKDDSDTLLLSSDGKRISGKMMQSSYTLIRQ